MNKYAKLAQKHIKNGHSMTTVIGWWKRMIGGNVEIKDGKAEFGYWPMKGGYEVVFTVDAN